ncbi:MAG: TerL [Chloroflexota bacterium]|nr:MAG: TerL [Chloroflexota bacterium]
MSRHDVLIQPQGAVLQEYFDSDMTIQVIRGPLGSGKTIMSCIKIIELMRKQEPNSDGARLSRWVAVRNTYSELFSTTIKDWLECNGYLGEFKQGGKEPPTQRLKFKLLDGTTVEAEMIFVAFDRPDHVKKARGLQLTGVWLNEMKEIPKPVVDMLDLRHGRYPSKKEGVVCTWHGMLGDTNAPDEDHWLYTLAEEEHPKDWAFFHQPGGVVKDENGEWQVNPYAENADNLPVNYYLRGMQGKSEDWIKVNLGNEYGFVSDGKPVHPRYIDSTHCINLASWVPAKQVPIILGFDFGRTPACAFLQKTSTGGWICFDEFICENMSALTFAPELAKYLKTEYFGYKFRGWGDPSGDAGNQSTDRTPIQILRAAGIPCSPTGSNKSLLRRAAVEVPLTEVGMDGRARLIILPKAKTIRKGLAGGFCYKRVLVSGEPRYHDEPDKNSYSHPVEALEYGLQGEGEGRQVVAGKNTRRPTVKTAMKTKRKQRR